MLTPLAAPLESSEGDPVAVRVSPRVMMSRGAIAVEVRVNADEANRNMRLEVESASFYASSDIQLGGRSAARAYERRWEGLPPGEYQVTATIVRVNGEELRAADRFSVVEP